MSPAPNHLPAWQALQAHQIQVAGLRMGELFSGDQDRFQRFSLQACDLFLDYSKNRITADTMALLAELARQSDVEAWRDRMFAGAIVNGSEQKPALHVALRAPAGQPFPAPVGDVMGVHGFAMRVHPVLRVYRMHEGVDIIGDVGTDVYATGDGVVRYAGRTQGGYGAVIEITHGYGYSTLYAHLSKVLVRPGRRVTRGQLIAKSGRSGLVSGPHLHYEVRYKGRKQNPVDYFFDDVDAARYRIRVASAN